MGGPTNITYVSMLVYDPQDRITAQQRIEWLEPLFHSGITLHLFVDEYYQRHLSGINHPGVHIRPWSFTHSRTWELCHTVAPHTPLRLPEHRNLAKDTEFFLALMHCKAELVALVAAEESTETPFVAFIDAGIHKIFKDPVTSWGRLAQLRIRKDFRGILLPGCWPPTAPLPPHGVLTSQISWIFCGGFFVVPRDQAKAFYKWQEAGLRRFLAQGRITWEVNTWVECMRIPPHTDTELTFRWFAADHNDRMVDVPAEFIA